MVTPSGWITFGVALMSAIAWYTKGFVYRVSRVRAELVPLQAKSPNALRIGLVGTSTISKFAVILPAQKQKECLVYAVTGRDFAKTKAFAHANNIPVAHESFQAMINDPQVDAVYISVPTKLHAQYGLEALKKGKHVLIEKPMTAHRSELMALHKEASERGLILVEAMHYRYHPVAKRLKEIVDSGELGDIKDVRAKFTMFDKSSFMSQSKTDMEVRDLMFNRWIYCVDAIMFVVGQPPEKILSAHSAGYFVQAEFLFPKGVRGGFVTDSQSPFKIPEWDLYVEGSKKKMFVRNFGFPFLFHRIDVADVETGENSRSERLYHDGESTFEFQLEAFTSAVQKRNVEDLRTTYQNALRNLDAIDQLRSQLLY